MTRSERIAVLEDFQRFVRLEEKPNYDSRIYYEAVEETIQDLKKLDEIEKKCKEYLFYLKQEGIYGYDTKIKEILNILGDKE